MRLTAQSIILSRIHIYLMTDHSTKDNSIYALARPSKYNKDVSGLGQSAGEPPLGYELTQSVQNSVNLAKSALHQGGSNAVVPTPAEALTLAANAAQVALRSYQSAIAQTANLQQALQNQAALADIATKEAKVAEQNYEEIENEVIGYQRRAEINTYYAKQYAAQAGVMKLLVWVCILLLLVAVLKRRGLITSDLANLVSGIIFLVGLILFIVRVYDLSSRNNMNFDEYTFTTPGDIVTDGGGESVLEYDKRMFLGLDTDDQTGLAWVGATLLEEADRGIDDARTAAERGIGRISKAMDEVSGGKKSVKHLNREIAAGKRAAAKAAAEAKREARKDAAGGGWDDW